MSRIDKELEPWWRYRFLRIDSRKRHKHSLVLKAAAGVVAALLLTARPATAQLISPAAVNPERYESRSGRYVLEVDPTDMHGEGPANYRLKCEGKESWSGERPYTLLDAVVGEDGVVAGYAYAGHFESVSKGNNLHLLILGPHGDARLDNVTPREMSMVVDGGPEPNVNGIVFDEDHDRVIFRVANVTGREIWKPYRLSTGLAQRTFSPDSRLQQPGLWTSIIDAQPVPDTPLTLVQWRRPDWQKNRLGVRFALVDLSGKLQWVLDLPNDYQAPPNDAKKKEQLQGIASESALLDVSRSKEFELRVTGGSERVRYRVQKGGAHGGWSVREMDRLPYVAEVPPASTSAATVPERPLRYLGVIQLDTASITGNRSLRNVQHFDFDDQGRFGFARRDGQCMFTFVRGTPGENKVDENSLGPLHSCSPIVAWAGGNTWLVTTDFADTESGNTGWWVDSGPGGEIRTFLPPKGVSVRAVASKPNGGVVLLGEKRTAPTPFGYELDTVLLWLDAQGRLQHEFHEADNSGSKLMHPDDVAVTATGETVVVDVIRHQIAVFNADGTYRRMIGLKQAWGREPNYPSRIAPDADGGFIVEDFNAKIPFVRMRSDGTVRGELRPRYSDDRPTGRLFRVRADRHGILWGSDGEALLRLSDTGVVQDAVGGQSSTEHLGEAAALVLDSVGRLYVADRRSGAVHVYSPDGKLQHICRPAPGDVQDALYSPSLTVTGDGHVYLRPDSGLDEDVQYIEFSSNGERLGRHSWKDRARLWNLATHGFWAVGFRDLSLMDEQGRVDRKVARRLDRRWLEWISNAVVAPDGSIAVAAHSNLLQAGPSEATINVIGSDGVPIRMVRLSEDSANAPFAYDGRTIAIWHSGEIWFYSESDSPTARFRPHLNGDQPSDWPLLFAAHGHELWMFDASINAVHRFAIP